MYPSVPAAYAEVMTAARVIPRKHYTARRAYSELEHLLADPSYAASAATAGRRIAVENGVRAASDTIESHPLPPHL